MKRVLQFFLIAPFLLGACSTKQVLVESKYNRLENIKSLSVVINDSIKVIPKAVYPPYNKIDQFVIKTDVAFIRTDSILCEELSKRDISCEIIYSKSEVSSESYYLQYQEYWAWDMGQFMPVMKIWLLKDNETIRSVASEGNTAGMHDYPTPGKQVPLLIDLLLKNRD